VCSVCQDKFSKAAIETKVTDDDSDEEAKDKVKKRKELYSQIRKERGDCEACTECKKFS
jgi:hypothetical protein